MNEAEVLKTKQFQKFKEQAHQQLVQAFTAKIKEEVDRSYIQIAINNFKKREEANSRQSQSRRGSHVQASKSGSSLDEYELEEGLQLISEIIDPMSYIYFQV